MVKAQQSQIQKQKKLKKENDLKDLLNEIEKKNQILSEFRNKADKLQSIIKNQIQKIKIYQRMLNRKGELPVTTQIREVVILLLTKQREQIDLAFQQYEDQLKELYCQIEYFKEQNNNLSEENNKLQINYQIFQIKEENEEINCMKNLKIKSYQSNFYEGKPTPQIIAQISKYPNTFKIHRWRELSSFQINID
ncbi:unnamed protein product (macronuclear) [Paramecium tetraurelia]|uniref:Uncharacterized protein n=1 Tax=Paramecium tetraurelia TaxID=5888 RepID=A0E9U1_PARTE|nr:uncharacterized protein GSPATT00024789001 [Paramecium tetraurelia]CAK92058.1 unnamed protein product [Paramecium tetraurelia]|eukprot:XP_001459455.1 hypothetical protein (macronuclear) [Paramecium tetraurelia strain d4-2]